MTAHIDDVTVMTFIEWECLPEVKKMYDEAPICERCDGNGQHECECGDTHECVACHGSGKIINLRNIYEKQLRSEIERLRSWKKGEAIRG